ncbi:unnamed protein product, partial [Laminaria digitata]
EVDAETYGKLHQIKHVLERWEISGINRKLQLKPRKWEDRLPRKGEGGEKDDDDKEDNEGGTGAAANAAHSTPSTSKGAFSSSGNEEKAAAAAVAKARSKVEKASQLLLILKWGGELTNLGQRQAIELGNSFRTIMYPDSGTGGLLRLH